jgi:hypothetical protein
LDENKIVNSILGQNTERQVEDIYDRGSVWSVADDERNERVIASDATMNHDIPV